MGIKFGCCSGFIVGLLLVFALLFAMVFGVHCYFYPETWDRFVQKIEAMWGKTKDSGDRVVDEGWRKVKEGGDQLVEKVPRKVEDIPNGIGQPPETGVPDSAIPPEPEGR